MARTTEPDIEFDPRHRIVGAIILVTLAIIVFPLILDERPASLRADAAANAGDTTRVADAEPAKSSKVIIKKLTDGKVATPAAPKQAPEKKQVAVTNDKSKPKVEAKDTRVVARKIENDMKPASADADSKAGKTESKNATSAAAPQKAAVTAPHWAVQVGTFSNPGNVRRLSQQLKEHGYSLMLKDIHLKQGSAVRVRVGPYSTRALADRAQDKIRQQLGVKGVVVAGP